MKIPIYHVDAFAVEPFKGNPSESKNYRKNP